MSARLSNSEIIGRVGMPPEAKHQQGETSRAVFTVAVDRLPRKDQQKRPPIWYRVTVFGRQAEFALSKITKGMQVFVAGDLDPYEKEGGGTTLEIAADKLQLLGESPAAQAHRVDEAITADRAQRPAGGKGSGRGSEQGGGLSEGY